MEALDCIAGAQQVVSVFGYWPDFHDAEAIWIRLNRESNGDAQGPTVEALIHAFESTNETDSRGYFVRRHHVLVHFRFTEVAVLRLDGFNQQNALFALAITDVRNQQVDRINFEVTLERSWGVGGSFQCRAVEVVSVGACDKAGHPV